MSWIEVGPSENEFTKLVLYSKSAMEQHKPSKVAHPSILFSTTDIESAYEKMKQNDVNVGKMLKLPMVQCSHLKIKMVTNIY